MITPELILLLVGHIIGVLGLQLVLQAGHTIVEDSASIEYSDDSSNQVVC